MSYYVTGLTAILLIGDAASNQQALGADRIIRAVEAEVEQALEKSSLERRDSAAAEYAQRFRTTHSDLEIPMKTLARISSIYSRFLDAGVGSVTFVAFRRLPSDEADTVAKRLGDTVFVRLDALPHDDASLAVVIAHELGHDKYDCVRWGMVKQYYGEAHLQEYQRRMESRADHGAIHLLHKAGLNASLMVRYLDRMYVDGPDKRYRLAQARRAVVELPGRLELH